MKINNASKIWTYHMEHIKRPISKNQSRFLGGKKLGKQLRED